LNVYGAILLLYSGVGLYLFVHDMVVAAAAVFVGGFIARRLIKHRLDQQADLVEGNLWLPTMSHEERNRLFWATVRLMVPSHFALPMILTGVYVGLQNGSVLLGMALAAVGAAFIVVLLHAIDSVVSEFGS